jgi:glycosyltransferase involved in cell wall biosynthesis
MRVCLIRQGFYPLDTRVRREVAALAEAGHEVDVLCVRRPGQALRERLGRITVYRLPLPVRRAEGRAGYLLRYAGFALAAALLAAVLGTRRRWAVVQVNSMPDPLVFAAAVPRLLGARVVLDLHECMPEFFSVKYGVPMHHPVVRLVAAAEQASIRFADRAITCTEQMRDAFVARGAAPGKLSVVLNSSDEAVFDAARHPPAPRRDGRFTLICHGAIERSYGHDTLVRAVALLRDELPGLRLEVYGDGTYREGLARLAAELGLDGSLWISDGWAPIEQLVAAIAAADAGVVAMRRDRFRDLTHCNKMFDFVAMRRPAIVSRTRAVEAYFSDDAFALFESGDEHDLARAIRALHGDPGLGPRLVQRASAAGAPYRWECQRLLYTRVIEELA